MEKALIYEWNKKFSSHRRYTEIYGRRTGETDIISVYIPNNVVYLMQKECMDWDFDVIWVKHVDFINNNVTY